MSEPAKKVGWAGLVPRLRFPEFRNGPTWSAKTLGAIAHFHKGKGLSKSEMTPDGKTPCVHYGELFTEYGEVIDRVRGRTNLSGDVVQSEANDVLMPTSDVTPRGLAKASCIKLEGAILSGDTMIVRPTSDNTSGEFLARYIRHQERAVLRLVSGSTVFHLHPTAIAKLQLAFPKPAEQQKIADCLSSLDDLIAARADKIAALKQHKQGLLEQLFPREGETVPRLRFPEFRHAPEWQPTTLGAVCDVLQGYGFPLTMQGKKSGRYPFCKVSDISRAVDTHGGLLGDAANYVDDVDVSVLCAKALPVGSTVFAKIGEALRLNRRAMTTTACLVDNNATGIKVKGAQGNDYFMFVLSQRIDMNQYCGGAVPSISKSTLESIQITVPLPDEQRRIADAFDSLDVLIAAHADKLAALKQHKQGLLQQLFPALDDDAP